MMMVRHFLPYGVHSLMVEHLIVDQVDVGSSPTVHPKYADMPERLMGRIANP